MCNGSFELAYPAGPAWRHELGDEGAWHGSAFAAASHHVIIIIVGKAVVRTRHDQQLLSGARARVGAFAIKQVLGVARGS